MNLLEERAPSLGWFLLLALLLHFFFTQMKWISDALVLSKSSVKEWWENAIVLENYKERRPVVQTSKSLTEPDIKNEEKAKYFGEYKNRVKEETQSIRKGQFQEGAVPPKNEEVLDGKGEVPGIQGKSLKDLLASSGASPNALKGVKEGSQTLLNTDKVLYASFINRIADEIYSVWVRHCQVAIEEIYRRGSRLDSNVFVTHLNVMMNEEGEIISILIKKSSGIPELDDAPKKAFWEVEPFPNPPKQLIEGDGYIHLGYEFHFEWKNSNFNIIPKRI